MKRLFTLFVIALTCTIGVWAQRAYFLSETISYPTGAEPATDGGIKFVQQDIWWKWYEAEDPAHNLTRDLDADHDWVWTVDLTGDLTIPTGHYLKKALDGKNYQVEAGDYTTGTRIFFEGNSGTIKVTATNPDYGGVTYSISYTVFYHTDAEKWDFYSQRLDVGRAADSGSSMNTHLSDWTLDTSGGAGEHVYFYNYEISDGSGNPREIKNTAPQIVETNGLLFYAPAGKFGLYNESDETGVAPDRFLALKPGAKVVIPASSYSGLSNPRIRIKMGRYGGVDADHPRIDLTITNALDALENEIATTAGDYKIGGSAWWGDKGDNHQRGEYHFIVNDENEDFTIEVHAGQWLKLYSIELYNSTELITENSVLGDRYQLLNVGGTEGSDGVTGTYHVHYRGKGEGTSVYTHNLDNSLGKKWDYWPTGTVTCTPSSFVYGGAGDPKHTYTSKIGEFGSFRIRLDCHTFDGKYCTDYASRSMSVGYLKKVASYPYTWDFTDVITYDGGPNRMGNAESSTDHYGEADYVYYERWDKRASWETVEGVAGHRVGKDGGGHNVIFCSGSQLWYGKTIIPELAGLGFTPSNSSSVYNNTLGITSGGLKIDQNTRDWWCYRIAVPNVPADGVVYVRAHPERSDAFLNAGYSYGDYVKPIKDNPGNVEIRFTSTNTFSTSDGSGDVIYVVPGNAESYAKNITLYFNGVTIRKIAVSTDLKTFNAKGWTTESRNRDIDPALTAEMNGRNITTYLVTGVDYTKKRVTMTPINDYLMHKATDDGQEYACILKNSTESTLNIVNGGFYLFVPDMHDEQGATSTSGYKLKNYYTAGTSIMKSKLNHAYPAGYPTSSSPADGTPIPWKVDSYTNFAFTYQYYSLTDDGTTTGSVKDGPQGFYRIAKNGGYSMGNQGYLPLLTANIGGDVWAGARGFGLSFDEDEGGEVTAIESIDTIDSHATAETAIYYSLSGQKLNGKPAKGGIYICNGKKIAIK